MIAVLRIAHKYCMETIEKEILAHLKQANDREGFVRLMVASQIVGSSMMHATAVTGLEPYKLEITIEEARMVGLESIHAIMVSTSSKSPSFPKPIHKPTKSMNWAAFGA